jgi:Tfp pilus assembly protein PilO
MIDNRIWYFGTALVAVGVLALGWLLGVSPKLDEAAAAESDRSAVEGRNHAIQAELRRLSVEFDDLSDMHAALTDLRKALPSEAETPSFLAAIGRLRESAHVTLADVSIGDAVPYAPPAVDAAAAGVAEGAEAATEDTTGEGSAVSAPVTGADAADAGDTGLGTTPLISDPRVTADNLILIPVEIEATGSRDELTAFLGALQDGERLYLVTDVATEVNTQPTDPGDYRSTITGYLYVLLPGEESEATKTDDAAPDAAPPVVPVPADGSAEVTDQ